jgi:hypothetical protein
VTAQYIIAFFRPDCCLFLFKVITPKSAWFFIHFFPVFFHPINLISHFPVLHFPPLYSGAAFSSPAFSIPVRRIFQSCIFHLCTVVPHFLPLHFGPVYSCPAISTPYFFCPDFSSLPFSVDPCGALLAMYYITFTQASMRPGGQNAEASEHEQTAFRRSISQSDRRRMERRPEYIRRYTPQYECSAGDDSQHCSMSPMRDMDVSQYSTMQHSVNLC